jgi:outer membrane immunogenic protein
MLKRFGTVACAVLVAATLLMPTGARAYVINGGIGGGGGHSSHRLASFLSIVPIFALISIMIELRLAGVDLERPLWLDTPEDELARRPVFNAMQSMMQPNGTAEPAWMSYAAKPRAAMPVKAIAARPATPWRGFYVGGNVGWGTGNNEWVDTFGDLAGVPGDRLHVNTSGILGGVHAGYEQQFGRWVLGVEGDFAWSGMDGERSANLPPATGVFNSETNWLGSVTGRVGYLYRDFIFKQTGLVYVKGGAAFAEFSHSFVLNGAIGPFVFPEQSATVAGWTIGAGTEFALNHNWAARIETMYYDFGSERYTFSHPVFGPARFDTDQTLIVTKVGLTYRFR